METAEIQVILQSPLFSRLAEDGDRRCDLFSGLSRSRSREQATGMMQPAQTDYPGRQVCIARSD